jgi:hypothetical protein
MPKQGLTAFSAKGLLVQSSLSRGWTLCVGAGISKPAFPDWKALVGQVMALDESCPSDIRGISTDLLAQYSADSVLAAAIERLGISPATLSDALYAQIRTQLPAREWNAFAKILAWSVPGDWDEKQWRAFQSTIEREWPGLTSTQIARAVASVSGTSVAPRSVLTFNAEPLLYSQLNCYSRLYLEHNKKAFDLVVRSTSSRAPDRIPYFCIHGLLPIPDQVKRGKSVESVDKLIFSECDYLTLANSNYSWQSNNFISAASNTNMVFIGLSMTDPNIRKWLAWVSTLRNQEIQAFGPAPAASTQHYWIQPHPSSPAMSRWIEALVAHLGVRLIWIESWAHVEQTLGMMLGKA